MRKPFAVFLDRDGVINDMSAGHVSQPGDLVLLPRAASAIKKLNRLEVHVFVVTNQGGVGLGYISEEALERIHDQLVTELTRKGAYLDEIRACTHDPDADCECRKPEPGLLVDLAGEYGIDLDHSWMVGDRVSDIIAGQEAGVHTILVNAKQSSQEDDGAKPDHTAGDLYEAVTKILMPYYKQLDQES